MPVVSTQTPAANADQSGSGTLDMQPCHVQLHANVGQDQQTAPLAVPAPVTASSQGVPCGHTWCLGQLHSHTGSTLDTQPPALAATTPRNDVPGATPLAPPQEAPVSVTMLEATPPRGRPQPPQVLICVPPASPQHTAVPSNLGLLDTIMSEAAVRVRESESVHLPPLLPQPLVRAPTAPVQQAEASEFREQTDAVDAGPPRKPPPPPSTQPPMPDSIARNAAAIARARTIIWNEPMDVFELGKV